MADWPTGLGGSYATAVGVDTSTSRGTAVTCSGSTNTKGSYAQLTASTPIDADGFDFVFMRPSAAGMYMYDVAIGAGGSEQIILANICFDTLSQTDGESVFIPLPIKAGTRVAVRSQHSTTASATSDVALVLYAGGFAASMRMGRATTYGADTATSSGTALAWSGSANTKGSWVELSSAVDAPIRFALALMGMRNTSISTTSASLIDFGVGAAASEIAVAENIPTFGDANLDRHHPRFHHLPISVKSGARLAARQQNSVNYTIDVIVIGFD